MNKRNVILLCGAAALFFSLAAVIVGCGRGSHSNGVTTAPTQTFHADYGVRPKEDPAQTEAALSTDGTGEQSDPTQQTVDNETQAPAVTEATKAVESTESVPTTEAEATQATSPTEQTSAGAEEEALTYEQYLALSSSAQREYFDSFEDPQAFLTWFDAAKEIYDKEHPVIEVTGPIDLEDIINQ